MSGHTLGAVQVAAMLTSASYGIGFLFGSGEQALSFGMAGAVYGLATALGMLIMALFAAPLWRSGLAVWDLFATRCGPSIGRLVALLSLIWMSGVLAAQIHGAAAVAALLGLGPVLAYAVPCVLILAASRLDLRAAALVFSLCLAASAVVLVGGLVAQGGVGTYLGAVPAFAHDAPSLGGGPLLATVVAVSLLACMGADYHQFVISARSASAGRRGCVLAALALGLLAFLPPALVVSAPGVLGAEGFASSKQVIPFLLQSVAGRVNRVLAPLMLVMLALAALGSGAAVLRAMASAMGAGLPAGRTIDDRWFAVAALGLALALASTQRSIVDTMVSVNVVYIASVGVSLVSLLLHDTLSVRQEAMVVGAGLWTSGLLMAATGAGLGPGYPDLLALIVGLGAAAITRAFFVRARGRPPAYWRQHGRRWQE